MSKAERLMHGESMMDHAMCFTGVTLDVSVPSRVGRWAGRGTAAGQGTAAGRCSLLLN